VSVLIWIIPRHVNGVGALLECGVMLDHSNCCDSSSDRSQFVVAALASQCQLSSFPKLGTDQTSRARSLSSLAMDLQVTW
jgi:hypothetical protein